jgi:inner membrane transporter RhtA
VPSSSQLALTMNRVPAWTLAVVAMLSIQMGSALSISLFDDIGPAGTAWLRLVLGAVILLIFVRPRLRTIRQKDVPGLIGLGVATGVMTSAFLSALERIPLGTTVAIEFLGPLGVAAVSSKRWRSAIWPLLALAGVVLLTEPWTGEFEWLGVFFALIAAAGWASYIILTQHVADRFSGIQGLALATPVAAITASVVGVPQAWGGLSVEVLLWGVVLAILTPVFPFALEMLALKRMNKMAFGTLMAVEPAIAATIGFLVLSQVPDGLYVVGVALVIVAGVATQRDSGRDDIVVDLPARLPEADAST